MVTDIQIINEVCLKTVSGLSRSKWLKPYLGNMLL